MRPTSANDGLNIARERAADADVLIRSRAQSAGPVCLAGYAIECSLKAFLQREGIRFPVSGSAGHDLRGLWQSSGFRLRDIADESGTKAFFIKSWNTDLRSWRTSPS